MVFAVILILITFLFVLLFVGHKWHFAYWQRAKIACVPTRLIVGNVFELIFGFCTFGEQFKSLYNHSNAKNESIIGIHVLFNRALLIRDPELIKSVLMRNFRAFSNRFETTDARGDSMGSLNLFFAKYEEWKDMHGIFTPFFASNKIKIMYPLMIDYVSPYEEITKLSYLDCVVKEILRLYPPTAFLDRCCNAEEGYDLKPFINYRIPKGMPVYISVLGLHHDEKYWPQPLTFLPERFLPENLPEHTPMTYLPFGAGPRGCIGYLLGLLQVKLGLVHILKSYRVEPCEKTQTKIKFAPKAFVLTAEGGTYLRFVKDHRN